MKAYIDGSPLSGNPDNPSISRKPTAPGAMAGLMRAARGGAFAP